MDNYQKVPVSGYITVCGVKYWLCKPVGENRFPGSLEFLVIPHTENFTGEWAWVTINDELTQREVHPYPRVISTSNPGSWLIEYFTHGELLCYLSEYDNVEPDEVIVGSLELEPE